MNTPMIPFELQTLNELLMEKGWHDLSDWWKDQIAQVYATNKRRAVFRVGRRGGKSATICRIAVYEALFVDHKIPPGDIGVFGIISADMKQAKDRINTIKAIFEALDLGGVKTMADQVLIPERQIAIRVYAASLRGVVGCTAIGWMLDEMTRWRDSDTGKNPAEEVIRSLMPTISTMPKARTWWISSPYSTLDIHYDAIEEGITNNQHVGIAPTWIANPTLTEEETRALEPDEAIWLREYAAIPLASDESKFFQYGLIEEARIPFDLRG